MSLGWNSLDDAWAAQFSTRAVARVKEQGMRVYKGGTAWSMGWANNLGPALEEADKVGYMQCNSKKRECNATL